MRDFIRQEDLPLRATPDEKDKLFSKTPSPRGASAASSSSDSNANYPYSPYYCGPKYLNTYSDDEEEYGAYLSAQYHAGWE